MNNSEGEGNKRIFIVWRISMNSSVNQNQMNNTIYKWQHQKENNLSIQMSIIRV